MKQATFYICTLLVLFQLQSVVHAAPAPSLISSLTSAATAAANTGSSSSLTDAISSGTSIASSLADTASNLASSTVTANTNTLNNLLSSSSTSSTNDQFYEITLTGTNAILSLWKQIAAAVKSKKSSDTTSTDIASSISSLFTGLTSS